MEWNTWIENEQKKGYFKEIENKLEEENRNYVIYPKKNQIYRPFETDFHDIKVVILDGDPYVKPNEADGLALSSYYTMPQALINIFRKIEEELGYTCEEDGDLTRWANQGVFLLNTNLTTRAMKKRSHKDLGWRNFTYSAIRELWKDSTPKVFILIGNGQSVISLIKNIEAPHLLLTTYSPENRNFLSIPIFKPANDFLISNGRKPINWR